MIRLTALELSHFKNVDFGRIEFPQLSHGGSVLGIYGQNGSGKTAVIEALDCIDRLLSGAPLAAQSADYLKSDSQHIGIKVSYAVDFPDVDLGLSASIDYEVHLASHGHGALHPVMESLSMRMDGSSKRLLIEHFLDDEGQNPKDAVSWRFSPKGRWRSIKAFSGECERLCTLAEGAAAERGTSFLFSKAFTQALSAFLEACKDDAGALRSDLPKTVYAALGETAAPLLSVIVKMKRYAQRRLYVLPTAQGSAVSFNLMFLSTVAEDEDAGLHGFVELDMDAPCNIRLDQYECLKETVSRINGVLGALIPGYSVEVADLGPVVLDQGDDGRRVELLSNRGGRCIPFRCESEGIQKITAITSLLIDVYNDEECCVVIDGFDSGVFEFLLGELLEVLSSKGKGQLIFTAHNLRALETLPPKCLVFTTSNPNNRFVRFKGVRPSNNLRDQYLRAINLGGQDEEVYVPTDKFAIDSAFYRAGHQDDVAFDTLLGQLKG